MNKANTGAKRKIANNKSKPVSSSQVKKKKIVAESNLAVFGTNDVGQLGLPEEIEEQETPVLHQGETRYTQVAAGGLHTVCLTEEGQVITFGCNDEGALGRPTGVEGSESIPGIVDVRAEDGMVLKVTAGDSHSTAMTENGRVYIWGNFRCQDGAMGLINAEEKCCQPTRIELNANVVDVQSGFDHVVLLSNTGVAYTMGCGDVGQLGRITKRSVKGGRVGPNLLLRPAPIVLKGKKKVKKIYAGGYATFLETQAGHIFACGLNNYNQLGIPGDGKADVFYPEQVVALNPDREWKQISCGQHHTLALDKNGHVFSMGNKLYGRLGLGQIPDDEDVQAPVPHPTMIPGLNAIKSIEAANTCSFAINNGGSIFSWGMGTGYILGHGSEDDEYSPKKISPLSENYTVTAVAGGSQHTIAIARKK